VDHYNSACSEAALDLLSQGPDSYTQAYDPTGEDVLRRAIILRRRLRALKRAGRLDERLATDIEQRVGMDEEA
jgi:hypothetical protein